MKRTVLLIFCLITCFWAHGQERSDVNENEYLFVTEYGKTAKSKGVKGTPFVFEEMKKGDILMSDGKFYQNVNLNIYPKKAQVFIGEELPEGEGKSNKTIVIDNRKLDRVVVEEGNRVFRYFKIKDIYMIGEVLFEDGDEKFVAYHEKRFMPAQVEAYSINAYDVFQDVIKYYLVKEDREEEVKKGTAGLKSISSDNWKALRNYMKDNKLDFGNPADMRLVYLKAKEL
ncbi:hypothetical protein KIH41_04610 [Litoribacter ruber]|uniref:hypothetical protein n=1 Tax=Litoribacter ruber TaxID=702568 RepID=UPI001BD99AD8|nr:hypothetical protein [Litoribacter ruber]MBT0810555.1 hypothetical protein [Litoribacter ruber]